MSRKSLVASLAVLLLAPAVVYAGLNIVSVVTGSASGAITPSGGAYSATAKTYKLRPNLASGFDATPVVTNNGAPGVVTNNGGLNLTFNRYSTFSYTAPFKGTTQNVNISFSKSPASATPVLKAVLPTAAITVPVGTTGTLSGQTSTILYLPVTTPTTNATATWSGTGLTFTPASAQVNRPGQVTTKVSAATAGAYTATLTLTAVGATASTATVTIISQGAGQAASNACLSCHAGGVQAVAYAVSKHATSSSSTCQACHNPSRKGIHPFAVVTSAICEGCHAATLSQTTHPANLTVSKCLLCHDSHDPAAGIANLGPAPAHPAVTLYTFEEVGMQMAGGAKVPVQVDANGKGMPYSPKQTCGTAGCHAKKGIDYTYDKISDHAFHSSQGRPEYVDSADGKFDATKSKPWGQSTAMVGKW